MKYVVTLGEREIHVELRPAAQGGYEVTIDGVMLKASIEQAGGRSLWSLLLDGASYEVGVIRNGESTSVSLRGQDLVLKVESEQARNARLLEGQGGKKGQDTIRSVMPGRVVKVLVSTGTEVESGTPLLILEAMKMENEIRAPFGGSVRQVFVKDGQTVVNGDPLVSLG